MSEESTERTYSAFWPMVLFLAAFAISCFYQLYEVEAHRNAVNGEIEAAAPTLKNAQAAQDRLGALINDLSSTAKIDNNAAAIIREAEQAGMLRVRSNPDTVPAAPAP
jgi:transcription initiation factor TFIIIB Brf1 subunit/transcription initiation factor TFIIB